MRAVPLVIGTRFVHSSWAAPPALVVVVVEVVAAVAAAPAPAKGSGLCIARASLPSWAKLKLAQPARIH